MVNGISGHRSSAIAVQDATPPASSIAPTELPATARPESGAERRDKSGILIQKGGLKTFLSHMFLQRSDTLRKTGRQTAPPPELVHQSVGETDSDSAGDQFMEISIKADDKAGLEKAETALCKLVCQPNGSRLLAEVGRLSKNGRSLSINVIGAHLDSAARPALTAKQAKAHNLPNNDLDRDHNDKATELASKKGLFKGKGTSAVIDWNLAQYPDIDHAGKPRIVLDEENAFVSLAHEMVHGYRMMKGTFTGGTSNPRTLGTPAAREEDRAVGIGKYANEPLSENGVRLEHGLPRRNQYRAGTPVLKMISVRCFFARPGRVLTSSIQDDAGAAGCEHSDPMLNLARADR